MYLCPQYLLELRGNSSRLRMDTTRATEPTVNSTRFEMNTTRVTEAEAAEAMGNSPRAAVATV
jgi:hypothetical protein